MTKRSPRRRPAASAELAALIRDLQAFTGRYVVARENQLLVLAVYCIHTHIVTLCQQTPYVFIHSPEPECGKSRVMEVMDLLVARPWMIVNPSDAVLFRKVHSDVPTLLWDEIDAVFAPKTAQYHEEKRGMLDQGHRRHGRVPRFIGDRVVEFNVFSPKVFAGIGTLPDTLSRRAIPISLKRRARGEKVEDFISEDAAAVAGPLRERIEDWAARDGEQVAATRPVMPEQISDRMKEGCFSLMAIAERADMSSEFAAALVDLLTGDRIDAAESMRIRLLRDIRSVFADHYRAAGEVAYAVSTTGLLERLRDLPEAPWGTYYGRGLQDTDLASLLRHYDIHSTQVKLEKRNVRGYRRENHRKSAGLADAWQRYLGGTETDQVAGGSVTPGKGDVR